MSSIGTRASARIARLLTSGQVTFGLRESLIVGACAICVSVVGAVLLS